MVICNLKVNISMVEIDSTQIPIILIHELVSQYSFNLYALRIKRFMRSNKLLRNRRQLISDLSTLKTLIAQHCE